jgi:hypothetical protein
MIKKIFSDLESCDDKKIKEALEQLDADATLKEQAERRYLKLIQARLNNPDATLADIKAASPSKEEVEFIREFLSNGNTYTLEYFDEAKSKAVVDFIGGIVASCFDLESYSNEIINITTGNELKTISGEQYQIIKNKLTSQLDLSSKSSWFAKIAQKIKSAKRCYHLCFDHTNFEDANKSLVLKEFIFFLFEKKHNADLDTWTSPIVLDIAQSTYPHLTDVVWLMVYNTKFNIITENYPHKMIPSSPFINLRFDKTNIFKHEAQNMGCFLDGGAYYFPRSFELSQVFVDIESGNEKKIQKSLKKIDADYDLEQIAEKRYLPWIRTRLNNPNATLADMLAATPTKAEVKLITSKKYYDFEKFKLNLKGLSAAEIKTFVNLIGSTIAACIDIDEYINKAKKTKEASELKNLLWKKWDDEEYGYGREVYIHLDRQYELARYNQYQQPKGWFTEILYKLKATDHNNQFHNLDIINFELDDEAAKAFNEAEYLKEFMYYMYRTTFNNGFEINIKQNIFPNLTNLFWVFASMPSIKMKGKFDLAKELPTNDLLTYSRELTTN